MISRHRECIDWLTLHVILKMAAIGFFVINIADPYVLKKAQSKDRRKISKVYFHGKKSLVC